MMTTTYCTLSSILSVKACRPFPSHVCTHSPSSLTMQPSGSMSEVAAAHGRPASQPIQNGI